MGACKQYASFQQPFALARGSFCVRLPAIVVDRACAGLPRFNAGLVDAAAGDFKASTHDNYQRDEGDADTKQKRPVYDVIRIASHVSINEITCDNSLLELATRAERNDGGHGTGPVTEGPWWHPIRILELPTCRRGSGFIHVRRWVQPIRMCRRTGLRRSFVDGLQHNRPTVCTATQQC